MHQTLLNNNAYYILGMQILKFQNYKFYFYNTVYTGIIDENKSLFLHTILNR